MQVSGHVSGRLAVRLLAICGLMAATPAVAGKTVVMTPTTINSALASVKPGDMLRMEGVFTSNLRIVNRDFGGVRVDASRATMVEGMFLTNVHNISFTGGIWGRSDQDTRRWTIVEMKSSSNISFSGATLLGNGNNKGSGLGVGESSFITIRNNDFIGHHTGIGIGASRDSLLVGNNFTRSSSDGIQMISNQRMIVSENRCTDIRPGVGAHPDCIQMWSVGATSLQTDIFILNNYAAGATQAFASFDPRTGSGARLTFAGNYAAVTYAHGVTCGACTDSIFVDNIFVTPFGAQHQVGLRTTNGVNIFTQNNQTFDFRKDANAIWPVHVFSNLVPALAGLVGSSLESRSHTNRITSKAQLASFSYDPVPEPGTWLLMLLGFALVGRQMRQARGPSQVLA
jgi:hypothetical protein